MPDMRTQCYQGSVKMQRNILFSMEFSFIYLYFNYIFNVDYRQSTDLYFILKFILSHLILKLKKRRLTFLFIIKIVYLK